MPRVLLNRLALAAIVPTLLLLATACATASAGSWKKGQNPGVSPVKETGYYDLIAGKDQVAARYEVQAGEALGFKKNAEGRVEAIAGMYTVPLNSTKTYHWQLSKQQ